MSRYKVISKRPLEPLESSIDEWTLSLAKELMSTYGLWDFTLPEIITRWERYSSDMCAGWLVDDKESVEYVFGVELEEVTEKE
jgi:hypothetical protein